MATDLSVAGWFSVHQSPAQRLTHHDGSSVQMKTIDLEQSVSSEFDWLFPMNSKM